MEKVEKTPLPSLHSRLRVPCKQGWGISETALSVIGRVAKCHTEHRNLTGEISSELFEKGCRGDIHLNPLI